MHAAPGSWALLLSLLARLAALPAPALESDALCAQLLDDLDAFETPSGRPGVVVYEAQPPGSSGGALTSGGGGGRSSGLEVRDAPYDYEEEVGAPSGGDDGAVGGGGAEGAADAADDEEYSIDTDFVHEGGGAGGRDSADGGAAAAGAARSGPDSDAALAAVRVRMTLADGAEGGASGARHDSPSQSAAAAAAPPPPRVGGSGSWSLTFSPLQPGDGLSSALSPGRRAAALLSSSQVEGQLRPGAYDYSEAVMPGGGVPAAAPAPGAHARSQATETTAAAALLVSSPIQLVQQRRAPQAADAAPDSE